MFTAKKFDDGENLNITGITRDAAGTYECGAENDIAAPDARTVKVTVNCKYLPRLLFQISFRLILHIHPKVFFLFYYDFKCFPVLRDTDLLSAAQAGVEMRIEFIV